MRVMKVLGHLTMLSYADERTARLPRILGVRLAYLANAGCRCLAFNVVWEGRTLRSPHYASMSSSSLLESPRRRIESDDVIVLLRWQRLEVGLSPTSQVKWQGCSGYFFAIQLVPHLPPCATEGFVNVLEILPHNYTRDNGDVYRSCLNAHVLCCVSACLCLWRNS